MKESSEAFPWGNKSYNLQSLRRICMHFGDGSSSCIAWTLSQLFEEILWRFVDGPFVIALAQVDCSQEMELPRHVCLHYACFCHLLLCLSYFAGPFYGTCRVSVCLYHTIGCSPIRSISALIMFSCYPSWLSPFAYCLIPWDGGVCHLVWLQAYNFLWVLAPLFALPFC